MPPIWVGLLFVFGVGACVGSFLNVVILRVPKGKSIVTPPSACPKCGHRLAFYDNIPIIGWFLLRGKCRYCKAPISFQYPMIEGLTASLCALRYLSCCLAQLRPDILGNLAAGLPALGATWPVLLIYYFLIGSLIASAIIDARFYIIPLPIVWLVTGLALVAAPLAAQFVLPGSVHPAGCPLEALGLRASRLNGLPTVGNKGLGMALGGLIGLAIANGLLWAKILPRGFDESLLSQDAKAADKAIEQNGDETGSDQESEQDDQDQTPPSPDQWVQFPHPRREALKELLFVLLPFAGMVIGYLVATEAKAPSWPVPNPYRGPLALHVLGGVACGYLVGAGLIWITRIFGTLGFGKEAMGLGDLHLLGMIGAVMGPMDAIIVFFIAPFLGLAFSLATFGVLQVLKVRYRPIPYGPHLCVASVVLLILHEPIMGVLRRLFLCP